MLPFLNKYEFKKQDYFSKLFVLFISIKIVFMYEEKQSQKDIGLFNQDYVKRLEMYKFKPKINYLYLNIF